MLRNCWKELEVAYKLKDMAVISWTLMKVAKIAKNILNIKSMCRLL